MIVTCLSSAISNVTPSPPPQEPPHHDEDAGGDCIATPPHPRATATLAASPSPRRGSSFSSPPRYSCRAEPRWSAMWPMINAAGCRAKSSPSRGAVVPVQGRARRHRPGPGGPPCGGVARGVAPGSGFGDGEGGTGFAPSCQAENASVTAGRTPGVMDQDLRRSEAWLGNRRRLTGAIRAVVAGLLPQAHRRGRGQGGASC